MAKEKEVNFEKQLARLEEIVATIESKTLPLDASIALYQEGKEIIKTLESSLKEAESKIADIIKVE
ncbi:MAG: exodeoxyribonuclease VII small subunit [Bacilli bacterium]|jgi:exodeoxyribonuclease VII small subunit|nr:exodeoxyribonuclease VII small subunit [Candidatus Saccharimonadaceae bacterium]